MIAFVNIKYSWKHGKNIFKMWQGTYMPTDEQTRFVAVLLGRSKNT